MYTVECSRYIIAIEQACAPGHIMIDSNRLEHKAEYT